LIRRSLILAGLVVAAALPQAAGAASSRFFQNDPMGKLRDVTKTWQRYQAAPAFCIKPNVKEYTPGGVGRTVTGRDPACRRSGFPRSAKGLVKITVRAPGLCGGCRRLFIDFSRIPLTNAPGDAHARGHAYYHLDSFNNTYTVDPLAHSPNTKDFTNDKLVAPDGSASERLSRAWEMHAIDYVTDTAYFVHTGSQGPYYIGPWYLSRYGKRVRGVYLDVDVADATQWPNPELNGIGYVAGFNSGGFCSSDEDFYYGGCFDWWGMSSNTIDPFAD